MDGLSDDVMVSLAKKGDVDAFAILASRYQEKVYNMVLGMTRNHLDAHGELPEKERRILEKHLLVCPSCQAYQRNLDLLREEALQLAQPGPEPEYFQSFSERVRAELAARIKPSKPRVFIDLGWKWAYAAAAAAFAAVMMLILITPAHRLLQDEWEVVISYEDAIRQIYVTIGDDAELEELFNTLLLASITAGVEEPGWGEDIGSANDPGSGSVRGASGPALSCR